MFFFKSPENGSYVEIDLVEKYLLFSTPAFREAGERACPGQFGDAVAQGFPLARCCQCLQCWEQGGKWMVLNDCVLEVPDFILFSIQKSYLQGS